MLLQPESTFSHLHTLNLDLYVQALCALYCGDLPAHMADNLTPPRPGSSLDGEIFKQQIPAKLAGDSVMRGDGTPIRYSDTTKVL